MMSFIQQNIELGYLKDIYILATRNSKIVSICSKIIGLMMLVLYLSTIIAPIFIYSDVLSILLYVFGALVIAAFGVWFFGCGIHLSVRSLSSLALGQSSKPVLDIGDLRRIIKDDLTCQAMVEYAILIRHSILTSYTVFSIFMMIIFNWWHWIVIPLLFVISYALIWADVAAIHTIKYKGIIP
jgi:hypothetical protein